MTLHIFIAGICTAQTTPPDLTAAGVIAALKTDPNATPVYGETYNLGATGLRGWIYIGGGTPFDGTLTVNSRQILVTVASTPGSAVLAVDDVILGAMAGSSGTVPAFTSDARKAFGAAITKAEKTGAGSLRVKRWRAGTTTDVNIAMTIMGDYSNTAPYTCPKSELIRVNTRNKLVAQLLADSNFLSVDYAGAIKGLALMAGVAPGDPDYDTVQTRLQTFARACASTTLPSEGGSTWHLGYVGLFLAEYYLLTNDTQVVSGLNNYTVTLAQMQSRYGTFGHSGSIRKADGSLHGTIPPYGPVNSAGIPANIAIVMGKKALLAAGQAIDPEIDPAIQRGSDFFGWYVNKGCIPYGEHEPGSNVHSVGGKDQMCAVLFGLQADRTVEAEYFSRFSIASFDGREYGHAGGQMFSYLWHAMGAHMGGELALAEYTKQIRWHLDMVRRTDGSFAYEGQEQFGAGSTADGTYLGASDGPSGFHTTASYLLTYSLPLKRLYITGKNAIPANTLDAAKVANAIAAATYNRDASTFTTTQLIAGLSEFDPVVRNAAAVELAKRTLTAGELTTLRTMVTGADANGRMGACQTLGLLKDVTALPLIAQRLDKNIETNSWVRGKAANAIRQYDSAAASTYRDPALTAFAANATDPEVIDWNDPLQRANTQLSFCLFGGWDETQNAVSPFDTISAPKNLLYPAVKAGLKQPDSLPRTGVANFSYNGLTLPDVQALIPDLIEVAAVECQANTMWSANPRAAGINTLAKWNISEAIPVALAMQEIPEGFGWGADGFLVPGLNALAVYGDAARWTLPTLKGYLATWDPATSRFTTLVNTIATIENAITAPTLIPGLAVANPQVVATTGAKAITLTGTSPRSAVTFTNVTQPANGTLTGTAPNLTYTPSAGYTGTDKFTFQAVDSLTTSEPGTVSIIVGSAAGTGITGTYFNNANFTSQVLTRTDPQINFDWGTGSPSTSPSIGGNTFSVRWSGQLRVPETGTYTFSTLNSDGARVYVNGQMVIDDYVDQTTNWTDGSPINLTAGQLVDLQMLYYENTGSAVAKLKWTGPSFSGPNGGIIGSQWLYNSTTLTPYAHAQTITMVKDTSRLISLSGSGSTLTYAIVTPPAQGTLTGTAPNLTYTPPAGFSGSVSFTFRVNNGTTDSAPATVSINVQSGTLTAYTWASAVSGNWNDGTKWTPSLPATAGLAHYALNFTTSGTYTATQDLSNGFQLNQLNTAANVTLAGTNSVSFVANGSSLPQFNQNGPDTVTVTHPISLQAMTSVGGSGSGTVSLTGTISGGGGIIKNNYGTLSINQNNTYSGGTIINAGTLAIGGQMNGALGTGPVTLNGGTLFLGRINAANPLTVSDGKIHSDGGWGNTWNGPVTLNGNLTVYVPYYDRMFFSGNISGDGGLIVQANSTNPDHAVNLSGTNTYSGRTSVTTGQLTCTTSAALGSGFLDIASGAKVNLNYTGSRTIASLTLGGTVIPPGTYGSTASPATHKNDTYFAGTGTVTVSNNAPVAVPQSVSTSKNTQTLITLAGTDAENNPLTYQIVSQPAHGTLSGTAPNVTYKPALNFYGDDSFSFRVNDGTIDSAVATVSITVTQFPNDPPPVISTLNPADEATGVAVTSNLVATFSENIVIGTGNITVRNLTDGTQTTIAVTDTTQVSISGAVLTINPTADLAANMNYAVQIAATAIDDTAGNSFAGITNDATWNFAPPDTIAPVISSLSPADNATAVAVGTNFVATFSENIAIGTGNITLKNLSDATQTAIDITDTTQVSISGNVLTINPTADLAADKNYAVQIAATAVKDLANNPFAGITDDTTWNFTTTSIGTWSTVNWSNDSSLSFIISTNVTHSGDFVGPTKSAATINGFTFEAININGGFSGISNPYSGSNFTFSSTGGGGLFTYDATAGVSGAASSALSDGLAGFNSGVGTVTYNLTGLLPNTNYEFYFFSADWSDSGRTGTLDGSEDGVGNTFTTDQSAGSGHDIIKYAYKTGASTSFTMTVNTGAGLHQYAFVNVIGDTLPPVISTLNPADNATGVAVGANFVATFSENIAIGTGDITVRNLTDGTQTTIAVTDTTQVSISGAVLTINPTANLAANKNYAVQIAATAIDDTAGNSFAGITNDATWNFAIPDTIAPVISSLNPENNATGVSVGANLAVTFSENIVAGTGNITLKNLSDATQTTIAITDTTQVWISGSALTINPTANLLTSKNYAIQIAPTAIKDQADNLFAGITNDTTWNFTTSATTAIPGLVLWLDASDASTMTMNGTTVNEWRDKTGSSAKMTRTSGTPTVVASGIGGKPTVNFTASSSSSMRDGVNHSGPVTIFYVSRQTGGSSGRVLTAIDNNWLLGYHDGYRNRAYLEGWVIVDSQTPSDTNPHLYATTIGGSGQNSTVWAEGTQIVSNQNGTQGPNNLNLGGDAYGEFSDCDISEVLVYNRVLLPSELDEIGTYLTVKYSLTTSYWPTGTDTTAPTVSTLDPAYNATGVAVGANLVATFSEPIAIGTGNITVKNLSDATQTTIDITDITQVSISGNVLTINPTADLATDKNYAIQIAATAVKDLANNPFAGITNDTTWNFTTIQTPYAAWSGGAAFGSDANGDGVENGMAWLLGAANASENAAAKLPRASINATNLRITFRCLKSTMRGGTVLKVQFSTDMGLADPWASHEAAVPDVDGTVNGVIFDTTDDGDFINVIADIPSAEPAKFTRLSATSAP
jgi:autotransporter-associated beta strand protein